MRIDKHTQWQNKTTLLSGIPEDEITYHVLNNRELQRREVSLGPQIKPDLMHVIFL